MRLPAFDSALEFTSEKDNGKSQKRFPKILPKPLNGIELWTMGRLKNRYDIFRPMDL
jgi:hypothetical protein